MYCYDLNVCAPQNIYVENPMPKVLGLEDETFERWLSHNSRALVNEIGASIEEVPESLLPPYEVRTKQEISRLQPTAGFSPDPDHAGTPILDLQPPEL